MEKTFSLDNVTIIYLKKQRKFSCNVHVCTYAQKNTCINYVTYLFKGGGLRELYSIFVVVIVAFVVDIDVIVVSSIFLVLYKPLMHCHMLFDLVLRNFFSSFSHLVLNINQYMILIYTDIMRI